jgi:tetratricopeptide (TPR) repeat protein
MGLFARKLYDRNRLLEQATKAARRRRRKRAISIYREILAVDANDLQVHRKIAPLLAQTKQPTEAWESYRRAASQLGRQGFVDQAIGIYREACTHLPRDHRIVLALADLEVERGRPIDAVNALVEGSRRLRSRRTRQEAFSLLQRARKIQPLAFEPSYEMAGLLARNGQRDLARRMLHDMAKRTRGRQLRKLRRRLFFLSPSPASAWHWLTASFARA